MATCTSADSVVWVWDSETGRPLRSFETHPSGAHCIAYTPDGTRLITGGGGPENVCIWDTHSAKKLLALHRHHFGAGHLAISPDGERLASVGTATDPRDVVVWSIKTGEKLYIHDKLGQSTQGITFTPDGRTLIVCNHDGIRVWDMRSKEREFAKGFTCQMALSPDGRVLAVFALVDRVKTTTRLLEILTGQEIGRFADGLKGTGIAFSPDSRTIALGAEDGKIRFFDASAGRECLTFPAYAGRVSHLTFSPDGKRLASVGGESESAAVLLWDVAEVTHRQLRHVQAGPKDIDKWCEELANVEAASAYRAVWSLVRAGEPAFSKLKSLMTAQAKPVRVDMTRLIADLDSDTFEVREKAQTALLRIGKRASQAVESALKGAPSLEQRRRLQLILDSIREQPIPAAKLMASRGGMVLEQIGSAEAWNLLRELAKGDPESDFTQEARLILQRRRVSEPHSPSRR